MRTRMSGGVRGRGLAAPSYSIVCRRISRPTLRSYVLAVVIQSVAVYAFVRTGVAEVPTQPFYWLAAVMGGLICGGGMALTGRGAASAASGAVAPLVREIHTIYAKVGTVYSLLDVGFGTAVSFAGVLAMWWFSLSYRTDCNCNEQNKSLLAPENLFPGIHGRHGGRGRLACLVHSGARRRPGRTRGNYRHGGMNLCN